jgi:hypothetical protein
VAAVALSSEKSGETAADVARYISDMTSQLELMASLAQLELLAYFLSMAHSESEAIARSCANERPAPSDGTTPPQSS